MACREKISAAGRRSAENKSAIIARCHTEGEGAGPGGPGGSSEGTLVAALGSAGGRPRARGRVGRPERPLDPRGGALARFALALRQLRAAAGYPTYRTLARAALFSPSVLSSAASGTAFPTLQVTLAYAMACGGDATEWGHRWAATAAELAATKAAAARPGAAKPAVSRPAVTWSASRHVVSQPSRGRDEQVLAG
jgi:hypothetical protein